MPGRWQLSRSPGRKVSGLGNMDLEPTCEHRLLVKTVRDFIAREPEPLDAGVESSGKLAPDKARAIFEASRALGPYAMNMPEKYGGGGLSAFATMLVEEQFCHTTGILIRRAFGNVCEVLLSCTGTQIERWLLPTVAGDRTPQGSGPGRCERAANGYCPAPGISFPTACFPVSLS